ERLIAAAAGTRPRNLRDQALVELLYGAGLRVSEAIGLDKAGGALRGRRARGTGLDKAGVDLSGRLVRVVGKGGKERIVPIGRPAAEALRRYLAKGRPVLDSRHRPGRVLKPRSGPRPT